MSDEVEWISWYFDGEHGVNHENWNYILER